jgi:hypothetical protein
LALPYPGSISTSSVGFGESDQTRMTIPCERQTSTERSMEAELRENTIERLW